MEKGQDILNHYSQILKENCPDLGEVEKYYRVRASYYHTLWIGSNSDKDKMRFSKKSKKSSEMARIIHEEIWADVPF